MCDTASLARSVDGKFVNKMILLIWENAIVNIIFDLPIDVQIISDHNYADLRIVYKYYGHISP